MKKAIERFLCKFVSIQWISGCIQWKPGRSIHVVPIDVKTTKCTTWSNFCQCRRVSRSTQKLSDRPASLEKIEASRSTFCWGIPKKGWSFRSTSRHPLKGRGFALMFWQHSGLNLIENISPSLFIQFSSQFVPNLHTALRIHSRYRLRLLSFTTIFSWPNFAPFSRPNLHDFPGRILHHFPGQIFATFFGRILQHSPIEFVESLATSELA